MKLDPKLTTEEAGYVVVDWPMGIEATRAELRKAKLRLERYRAALRLAGAEIEQRNQGMIALTTFAHQASQAATPSALLKLALVQALETLKAPMGTIVLIDAKSKELILGTHKGLTTELSKILTGQQLDSGATALMPHLVAGEGALLEYHSTSDEAEKQLLRAGRIASLVSLPLQLGPRLMGALLVGLPKKRVFKPTELYFLMALGQETAIALDSLRLREGLWLTAEAIFDNQTGDSRLQEIDEIEINLDDSSNFSLADDSLVIPESDQEDLEHLLAAMMDAEDEVQQQNMDLQTLDGLSEIMNRSLNLHEILNCAVEQTQTILETDAAWLYLIDHKNRLDLRAHIGLSEVYVRGMKHLKFGDSVEGQAAAENQNQFVENVAEDDRPHKIWVDKEGFHALAAIPLAPTNSKSQRRTEANDSSVIGVLAVGQRKNTPNHSWNPREIRMMNAIAHQIARAIDNARLYDQVKDEQIGLRAGHKVLQEVNDMLLEENSFLVGFIQDELLPGFNEAVKTLNQLIEEQWPDIPPQQKESLMKLYHIMVNLGQSTQETDYISDILNSEFNKVLELREEKNYTKPIRLTKQTPSPRSAPPPPNKPSKPLTFEEAVAAGLVPDHILGREQKAQSQSSS